MRRILFPAPLTFDLLGYGNDTLIEETLIRAGLMMATFDGDISAYGIVDSLDPSNAITGSTRPLSVSVATANSTLTIQAGIAVFQSGEIIIINESVPLISLADYTPNSRNIVYLEFNEREADPVLTRHNTLVNSRVDYLDSDEEYIKVLVKDDYDNLSIDARALTIPLAIVTTQVVTSSGGGTTTRIAVDLTRNTYSDNRPWFSVVDAEHRSHIGTGAITSVNVHGLSINDLSAAGDLTFLQVALDHGMIVSKDRGIAGVPGYLCTETITPVAIDNTGNVTGIINARYFKLARVPVLVHRVEMPIKASGTITNSSGGTILDDETFTLDDGVNPPVTFTFDSDNSIVLETNILRRVAFTASNTPSQLRNTILAAINAAPVLNITAVASSPSNGVTVLTNDKTGITGNIAITETVLSGTFIVVGMTGGIVRELAHFWVPGSNLISILPNDELVTKGPSSLLITYSAVDAAEPIIATVNPTFNVKIANTSEVVVSGGLFLSGITGTSLSFENEGPIPSNYTAYVDSNGALQKFPQTVFCYKKLNSIGFALQSFENAILGNCRLKVFLAHTTGATIAGALDVQIQITGQDTTGITVTETVKFTAIAATGSIQAVAGSDLVDLTDNEYFTLNDGINPPVVFVFDANSSVIDGATLIKIAYNSLQSASVIAGNIVLAINNAAFKGVLLNISAVIEGTTLVRLTNTVAGNHGNQTITETVVNSGFIVTGMSGGSGWEENAAPSCSENPDQYIITETVWSAAFNMIVSVRDNDNSGDTAILIQALIDPVAVSSISDVLPVAEIIWDGQQVCSIRDIRPINTSLSLPNYISIAAAGPMTASFIASLVAGDLYQYWAEDFDKPRLVTTEVTDTTEATGLVPTESTLTKLAKGLGRNDTYVSRPIPIKPYNANAEILRFVPIQAGAYFTLKVRYYRAGTTNAWSNWSTLTAPYQISIVFADVIKWQMVVTGPVEGMYIIMTTTTGTVDTGRFIANFGAFVDGVFL